MNDKSSFSERRGLLVLARQAPGGGECVEGLAGGGEGPKGARNLNAVVATALGGRVMVTGAVSPVKSQRRLEPLGACPSNSGILWRLGRESDSACL